MNKYRLTYLAVTATLSALTAILNAQESEVVELADFEVVAQYLQTDQVNALKTPTPIRIFLKVWYFNIRPDLTPRAI